MYPITLSSRYRITIPRALREQLNLRPGRSTRYVVIVQNSAKGGKRGLSPCCSCFSSPIPQASRRANGAPPGADDSRTTPEVGSH